MEAAFPPAENGKSNKITIGGQCFKFSKYYIILVDYNFGMMTIFSTRTGKIVEVDKNIFETIIEGQETEKYSQYYLQLRKSLLLIPYEENEWETLRLFRQHAIQDRNRKPITNYVIAPTMDCNARCAYCFEMGVHHDTMTVATAQQLVEFISSHCGTSTATIHWFGGEPLLATDIINIISGGLSKKKVNFVSKITTNGYYLSREVIKKALSDWHTVSVQVTIDDIGEKYNAIKKYVQPCVPDPFSYVMNNIQTALDNGLPIRIRINYDPNDIEKVEDIIEFTQARFKCHSLLNYHPQAIFSDDVDSMAGGFRNLEKHPFLSVIEYEREFDRVKKKSQSDKLAVQFKPWCNPRVSMKKTTAVEILCKHLLYPIPVNCFGVCNDSVAVDSHGNIFACQRMLGHEETVASGNVWRGIMENETLKFFQRTDTTATKCRNCRLLPLCQGGCKFKAMTYKKNHSCLSIKSIPESALIHALEEMKEKLGSYDALFVDFGGENES